MNQPRCVGRRGVFTSDNRWSWHLEELEQRRLLSATAYNTSPQNTPFPVVLHAAPVASPLVNLLTNGDFESGDFTGWSLQNVGSGTFAINDGLFDPTSPDGPLPPYNGSYSAFSDQTGPGTNVLYQDVSIPPVAAVELRWVDQIRNHAGVFEDPNQEFRVEIRTTGDVLLSTVFSTDPGDDTIQPWTARSADLSAYAGQTVRIAFVQEDNLNYFNLHLDDVRLAIGGEIHGVKWHDENGNGLREPLEPGLPGWTIFLDENGNRLLDEGETFTVTANDGSYAFTELAPGDYTVVEVPQDGWIQTFPSSAAAPVVAVFDDPSFVDTDGSFIAESDNVQASLAALGYTVHTFTGTSAASFAAGLAGADVLVIPEQERGNIVDAMTPDARAVVYEFVSNGGGLVVHGFSNFADDFLNGVFGYTLGNEVSFSDSSDLDPLAASGTAFDGGPASLPWNDGTYGLDVPSLPGGSRVIYRPTAGIASVVLMPQDLGQIVFLGWDWFNAQPVGTQDGGWLEVLDAAITEVGGGWGVHQVTIEASEIVLDRDFGNQALLGEIHGIKWHDENKNGVYDPGEAPLAGWTIFLDANENGHLDFGELSTTTGVDGSYAFYDVLPGTHRVAEVAQFGWRQTYPTTGAVVAVYDDPSIVDTAGLGESESDNVQAALATLGFAVQTFTGTTAEDFVLGLEGADILLLPEQENGSLYDAMSAGARVAVQNFVSAGGGLIVHGFSNLADDFLNGIFGYGISEESSVGSTSRTGPALSTAFADTGPTLPWNNGTDGLVISSLPGGSRAIFEDGFGVASVALIPEGLGQIVYLGWDWYEGAPVGSQDSGWLDVLRAAVWQIGPAGVHEVTLAGEVVADVNFGNTALPGEIHGVKFNDLDGDGQRDPGEPGLAGWTIYVDTNFSGTLDGGEPYAVTGPDGSYAIYGVPSGSYQIAEVPQQGWQATLPQGHAPRIAVFDDPTFVDSAGGTGAESDNVQATLAALGYQVQTFTGTSEAAFVFGLAGADVLLVPELENGNLASALSPGAISVINQFVTAGGGLIVHGYSGRADDLLNIVFGYSIGDEKYLEGTSARTLDATGTYFANGPATLPWNNGTGYLPLAGLPAGTRAIYNVDDANTAVALIPQGSGKIAFLGWDWFNAQPVGSQDSGWLTVLDAAVKEVGQDVGWYSVGFPPGSIVHLDFGNREVGTGSVAGRHLFYNQSKFDGNTAGVSASDDGAIAPDKTAYLPGSGTATFANISSYTRGINGIMIDLQGAHGVLTPADFIFKTGASNTPSTWATAPDPVSIVIRAGVGVGGSDRVELIWNIADSVKNSWLQVTVRGNDATGGFNTNTGLASSDTFFFGSRIGDIGTGTATAAQTTAADEIATRNNTGAGATITNIFDHDRSGTVVGGDAIASRNNTGVMVKINISNPPAAPEAEPFAVSGAGIASAIATRWAVGGDGIANPPIRFALDAPRTLDAAAPQATRAWNAVWALWGPFAADASRETLAAGDDWTDDDSDWLGALVAARLGSGL